MPGCGIAGGCCARAGDAISNPARTAKQGFCMTLMLSQRKLSQNPSERCCYAVNAPSEAVAGMKASEAHFEIEAIFHAQYERIARVIARVTRDPARAEELAVEVFLKFWRNQHAHANSEAWLYRVAVRAGLNELRARTRRSRYEALLGFGRKADT